MRSFVDFYNENSIIPVYQEITSYKLFLQRRIYLLNSLGIPLSFLSSSSFCEFGPGTGQNSSALIDLGLKDITLVEGSEPAIPYLEQLRSQSHENVSVFDIIKSDFTDFYSSKSFDIVWAEGCIPHQSKPAHIAHKISSHVNDCGIFVLSTISGLSHLSETFRRVISSIHLDKNHPSIEDLHSLVDLFAPDLDHLKSRSRPVRDWCLDVIIQPLYLSKLFSLADAIKLLNDNFFLYHSLPSLQSPFYWYKSFDPGLCASKMLDSYYQTNMCLVCKDLPVRTHPSSIGESAEVLGDSLWETGALFQQGKVLLDDFLRLVTELSLVYKHVYPELSGRLDGIVKYFQGISPNSKVSGNPVMQSFWGRGQQYASFARKPLIFSK